MAAILTLARFCAPSSELQISEFWYGKTTLEDLLGAPADKVYELREWVEEAGGCYLLRTNLENKSADFGRKNSHFPANGEIQGLNCRKWVKDARAA